MADIKFDKRNYRKHNDKNKQLIRKSLEDCGTGRSILIDKEGEIIAGNGVYAEASKLNIPVKIIETDGNELIAIKRTDLSTDDDKRKQLAVMDNTTSDSSSFDIELLNEDFEMEQLNDWGLELNNDKELENIDITQNALNSELDDFRGLIYEKQGNKPLISELYSDEGIEKFLEKIKQSNITDAEKDFLSKALTRFYRFNFKNIAEYYCHSNDEFKNLCEELVLVIPDGKKLLRNSLLKLDDDIYGGEND